MSLTPVTVYWHRRDAIHSAENCTVIDGMVYDEDGEFMGEMNSDAGTTDFFETELAARVALIATLSSIAKYHADKLTTTTAAIKRHARILGGMCDDPEALAASGGESEVRENDTDHL